VFCHPGVLARADAHDVIEKNWHNFPDTLKFLGATLIGGSPKRYVTFIATLQLLRAIQFAGSNP
jgi:hypothetical protein